MQSKAEKSAYFKRWRKAHPGYHRKWTAMRRRGEIWGRMGCKTSWIFGIKVRTDLLGASPDLLGTTPPSAPTIPKSRCGK